VRHVRMLGLCLVAAFAVSAVVAMPALAKKSEYNVKTFGQFKGCPYTDPEVNYCYAGITSGGRNGGYFELGNVTVKLSKPITLQGGFIGTEGELTLVPATNGYQTLEAPELKVQGGLGLITTKDQEEAGWPEALKQSFKEAKKNKETTLNVKIELAGNNLIYETPGALDTENIIGESGPAFKLPLKVRMINPWLERLGGGPCEIGNDTNPVWQYLTTEKSGRAGSFSEGYEFLTIELAGSRLNDLNWSVEEASRASGCGSGEDEAYVDAAVNGVLEQGYRRKGITVLQGNLYTGNTPFVREKFENGEAE
jgi:hypothetical protein